jgi:hypothetical protein
MAKKRKVPRPDPEPALPTPRESWTRHVEVLDLVERIRRERGRRQPGRPEPATR